MYVLISHTIVTVTGDYLPPQVEEGGAQSVLLISGEGGQLVERDPVRRINHQRLPVESLGRRRLVGEELDQVSREVSQAHQATVDDLPGPGGEGLAVVAVRFRLSYNSACKISTYASSRQSQRVTDL